MLNAVAMKCGNNKITCNLNFITRIFLNELVMRFLFQLTRSAALLWPVQW